MIYIVIPVVLLYYYFFLFYYRKLFPMQKKRPIQVMLILAIIASSYIYLTPLGIRWLRLPVIMIAMSIGLRFSTGMDWLQAVYGGSFSVLNAYCFRGILAVISAIIFGGQDLSNIETYYASTVLVLPLVLLFLTILYKTILPDDKLKLFLYNRNQLKYVVTYEITAAANLVVINSGRDLFPFDIFSSGNILSPYGRWYVNIGLGAYVLTIGMLIYAIYQSIRSTELQEYQWRMEMLEEQYERQVRHYKSYQKYTESFRAFKHDYRSMMVVLKSLIRTNDNEKALLLIDDMFEEMQKKVVVHKKYSDSVILDAMLQDLSNICEENKIRLSSNVSLPRNTGLSTIDAVRIFSNFINNAVEACYKVPVSDRFIDIVSTNELKWVTLQVVNSYNGKSHVHNGKFLTTKPEKQCHGLGLRIVEQIAEGLGGFVIYEEDFKNKTFLVRIHIPRLSENQKG
ncbi:sensor histidine kinase [Lacrimispora celerecrescens]|uniref:GHKL domain-containing protein n=1 Tax=[Clostridium] celerecrescens 18A TaxID=1286362 RepID=A0A2M8ZB65_9FIRM|nr:ATP-binding protein [Lacrimispora celerecrescens]PJJ30678.1 GHKL domain-containing protein [[Clostridium] celerecrescens 18A]